LNPLVKSFPTQMAPLEPPFTEAVLSYDTEEYDFVRQVQRVILRDTALEDQPLDRLHHVPLKNVRRRAAASALGRPSAAGVGSFHAAYSRFIRDLIRPHLGEDYIIFERGPNLRIHLSGDKALTNPHTDAEYGHSSSEINFWLPLTDAEGSATLWAESSPGLGDYHPFVVGCGQAVRFYGNQCLHFSKDNDTNRTRVSFDFRVVRLQDFSVSGIPLRGESTTARWTLFGYYGVMGPHGEVARSDWDRLTTGGPTSPLLAPEQTEPEARAPSASPEAIAEGCRRPRSASPEHTERCVERWGSERAARKSCARCGWLAHRSIMLETLTFEDASGVPRPWISENKDKTAPWGLGCVICNAARRSGLTSEVPESAFTEFSYGTFLPGLMSQPLARHGNNCKRQDLGWTLMNHVHSRIERDAGHDAAAAWVLRDGVHGLNIEDS